MPSSVPVRDEPPGSRPAVTYLAVPVAPADARTVLAPTGLERVALAVALGPTVVRACGVHPG